MDEQQIRLADDELISVFDSDRDDEFDALNEHEAARLKQLIGARDSGKQLANHRWSKGSVGAGAQARQARLQQAERAGAVPTAQGTVDLQKLTDAPEGIGGYIAAPFKPPSVRPRNEPTPMETTTNDGGEFGGIMGLKPTTTTGPRKSSFTRDVLLDPETTLTGRYAENLTPTPDPDVKQFAMNAAKDTALLALGMGDLLVVNPLKALAQAIQSAPNALTEGIHAPSVGKELEMLKGTAQFTGQTAGGAVAGPLHAAGVSRFIPGMPADEEQASAVVESLGLTLPENLARFQQNPVGYLMTFVGPMERPGKAAELEQTTRQNNLNRWGTASDLADALKEIEDTRAAEAATVAEAERKANADVVPEMHPTEARLEQARLNQLELDANAERIAPWNRPQMLEDWSQESGFKFDEFTQSWLIGKNDEGFGLDAADFEIRSKRVLDAYKAEPQRILEQMKRNEKFQQGRAKASHKAARPGERGSIDPQVFRDIYDLGAHVYTKIKTYAEWVRDMVKATGIKSTTLLRQIYDQVSNAVRAAANPKVEPYTPTDVEFQHWARESRDNFDAAEAGRQRTIGDMVPHLEDIGKAPDEGAAKLAHRKASSLIAELEGSDAITSKQAKWLHGKLASTYKARTGKDFEAKGLALDNLGVAQTWERLKNATWSNAALLTEKLPPNIKAESLINALKKEASKAGLSFGDTEVDALRLGDLVAKGGRVSREDLRAHIADKAIRVEKRTLPSGTTPGGADATALYENYTLGGPKSNYQELLLTSPGGEYAEGANRGHFVAGTGSINPDTIIAHMRVSDRPVEVGGQQLRTLFNDEFQSDLTLAARRGEATPHPLSDSWLDTSVKHLLREAVDRDVDAVAWTTGEQQKARYDLAKTVDSIEAKAEEAGPNELTYEVTGWKSGEAVSNIDGLHLSENELTGILGKDIADKVVKQVAESGNDRYAHIEGKDLQVGGKWANELYDKQAVNTVNKWAKRFGGRVEEGKVNAGDKFTFEPGPRFVEPKMQDLRALIDSIRKGEIFADNEASLAEPVGGLLQSAHFDMGQNLKLNFSQAFGGAIREMVAEAKANELPSDLWHAAIKAAAEVVGGEAKITSIIETVHMLRLTPEMKQSLFYEGNPTVGWAPRNLTEQIQSLAVTWQNAFQGTSREGASLGSMGGNVVGEFGDRLSAAIRAVSKEIGSNPQNFDIWADTMKTVANRAGMAISDEQLRKAWNDPQLRQQPGYHAAANAIADAISQHDQSTHASRFAGRAVYNAALTYLPESWGHSINERWGNSFINYAENVWLSRVGTSPQLSRVRVYAPAVFEAAGRVITAKGLSFALTRNHFNELAAILPTKGSRATFANLILHDRAEALVANKQRIQAELAALPDLIKQAEAEGNRKKARALRRRQEDIEVPADHRIPMMTPDEYALATNDPKIIKAIAYWKEKYLPVIEALTEDAGIESRISGRLGLYNRMKWVDPEVASKQELRDQTLVRAPGGATRGSPWDVRRQPSPSARRATGAGPAGFSPENSLFHMINATFDARIPSIAVDALRDAVAETSVGDQAAMRAEGRIAEPHVRMGNRVEPLADLTLEDPHLTHRVPAMVADAYATAMRQDNPTQLSKTWDQISSIATVQSLMVPAEAVRHGTNVIQVMATLAATKVPGMWAGPEAALAGATLGLSRVSHALVKSYRLEGPEFAQRIAEMSEAGALRLRNWEGYGTEQNAMLQLAHKVPPLGALADTVFGDPGTTQGIKGMETRMRVVLWDLIKDDNPGMSNMEIGRKVNDSMGTYVRELMPPVARALAPIDPFIRAGLALTKTGIKQAVGVSPTGKFSPWNLAATYGSVIAAQYYSSKLDDKGRMPHEIPGWKPTYALYWQRGEKTYHIGLGDVVGPLSRASNLFGFRGIIEAAHGGATSTSRIAGAALKSTTNFALGRIGPWVDTFFHLWGREPYILGDNSLMRGTHASMTGSKSSPLRENLKLTAAGLVPWVGKLAHLASSIDPEGAPEGDRVLPENHLLRILDQTNQLFKFPYAPEIRAARDIAPPVEQYITTREFEDTMNDIVRRARNVGKDRQAKFVQEEIAHYMTGSLVSFRGKVVPANATAFGEVMTRLGKGSAGAYRTTAIQNINAGQ